MVNRIKKFIRALFADNNHATKDDIKKLSDSLDNLLKMIKEGMDQ